MTDKPTERQQTIAGLRELIDFLDANPDVPISPYLSLQYSVDSTLKSQGRTPGGHRRYSRQQVEHIMRGGAS